MTACGPTAPTATAAPAPYEVKKGSLILHYANGSTVAIACNIDGNTLL